MPSTPIVKTGTFTIADADIAANFDSVTYVCTGSFAIIIPSSGVTAGNMFTIMSTDGLQTFTETGTVEKPLYRNALPFGADASMVITCTSTGNYKLDGDLEVIASVNEPDFAFHVHKNGTTQTPTYDVWEIITWSTSEYSLNIDFDFTNNRFVAPSTGLYHLGACLGTSDLSDQERGAIAFYVDGSAKKYGTTIYASVAQASRDVVFTDLYLTAGQYVEVFGYHGGAAPDKFAGTTSITYFFGHKVSGTSTDSSIVYETEITTAADTITVPAYLLGDKEYKFKLSVVNDHASSSTISMSINGDTTTTNYNTETMYSNEGSILSVAANNNIISSVLTNPGVTLVAGDISVVDSKLLSLYTDVKYKDATDTTTIGTGGLSNIVSTFSSITDIKFTASQTTGFGVGTRLKILRD